MIKSQIMRLEKNVASMGKKWNAYKVLEEKPEWKNTLDLGKYEITLFIWIIKKWDGKVWTGFIWLMTETSGTLLWTWDWTSRFHKMLGISWLGEKLLASQEGFCSLELVSLKHKSHWHCVIL
jgi:hypothetical protein